MLISQRAGAEHYELKHLKSYLVSGMTVPFLAYCDQGGHIGSDVKGGGEIGY